jgi:hypothetical protein
MAAEEQLDLRVPQIPVRNPERDECCPDFRGCRPELLADERARRAYKEGDAFWRHRMRQVSLQKWIEAEEAVAV